MRRRITNIVLFFLLLPLSAAAQDFYRVEPLRLPTRGFDELAPVPYKDGILFVLGRPSSSPRNPTTSSGKPMTDIYYVERKSETNWGVPELLSTKIKTPFSDGPATVSEDGNLICFSRMYRTDAREKNNPNTKLMFADLVNEQWVNIREFNFNDKAFSLTTPFLTPDGKTLYFSADMDNSVGKFDIYKSTYVNDSWSEPENLGSKINSVENEFFPFLHSSGKLYFSSQGHGSRGDYDIFYSEKFMGEWIDPIPLERFNSRSDDYSLIMSDDYSEGYFTRRGGSWDIFRFYTNYPVFENPQPIQRNRWKFRLRENSLDTIDYTIFEYEWVINDTLHLPGHEVIFRFPKPGNYECTFNVHNKITDTTMYNVGTINIPIALIPQPVITCPDTVKANELVRFSAAETHLPEFTNKEYYWDFGDGMKDEGRVVNYQFRVPGVKEIVLTVKENIRKDPEARSVYKEIVVVPDDRN